MLLKFFLYIHLDDYVDVVIEADQRVDGVDDSQADQLGIDGAFEQEQLVEEAGDKWHAGE